SPPGVDTLHLPAGTPVEVVVQAHDARVAKFLERCPGAQPVRMNNVEDTLRAQDRLQEIKAAFRRSHGISKAELERMAGMKGQDLDLISAKADRLHQQSRAT